MAKTFVWTLGTGFWSVPGNWIDHTDNINPSQIIPGSGVTVIVYSGAGTITAGADAASAATAGLVQFQNTAANYAIAGFLDVTELDVLTPLTITGTVSATARVSVQSTMTINGTLSGGAAVSVDAPYGQITAQNGAQVTVSGLSVGITAIAGVMVTGTGTSWTTTATTVIGTLPSSGTGAGIGTLNIAAGATFTGNGQALVGSPLGTSGTVTVSNGGQWIVGDILGIGAQGTGTVVADGGTITAQNQLQEGSKTGGNATLTIQNGGVVSAAGVFIGLGAGSQSTLSLAGATDQLHSSAGFVVGDFGTGTVTDTGGTITAGITQLGTDIGGKGSIAISGGGKVTVSEAELGKVAGGTGTITVDGTGSTFADTSNLFVGAGGIGILTVSNGGSVTSGNLNVGVSTTGTGSLTIDSGGTATGSSVVQVGAAGTVTLNSGTLGSPSVQIAASGKITGAGTFNGAVVNNGTLDAEGGTLIVTGALTGGGTGSADIVGSGATLELQSAVSTAQTIQFSDATGTVIELAPPSVATYSNFVAGDVIDLENITVSFTSFQNGVLSLHGTSGVIASLNFGSVAGTVHATTGTGTASAPISVTLIPCFAEGTRIDTPTGPVAVERIRVGDPVRTLSGGTRTVVWVGHREVELTGDCVSDRALPVLFARGAFGPAVPSADVVLSPDHAVFWGGVMIPARLLVNGSTVRRVRPPRIAYWHIELDRHDVVLAEGLPAETYLDTGDRAQFAGLPIVPRVDEAARRRDADGCAEWVVTRPILDAARAWLAEQPDAARRAA